MKFTIPSSGNKHYNIIMKIQWNKAMGSTASSYKLWAIDIETFKLVCMWGKKKYCKFGNLLKMKMNKLVPVS